VYLGFDRSLQRPEDCEGKDWGIGTALYQLVDDHFDSYVRGYEEQFEPPSSVAAVDPAAKPAFGLLKRVSVPIFQVVIRMARPV
jgi:hypothetical protein